MGSTTIQVSEELADELHSRKARGDSYEDVIWRLLDEVETLTRTCSVCETGVTIVVGDGYITGGISEGTSLDDADWYCPDCYEDKLTQQELGEDFDHDVG